MWTRAFFFWAVASLPQLFFGTAAFADVHQADSPSFILNTIGASPGVGGSSTADSAVFPLDTRPYWGPFFAGPSADSDSFTLDTRAIWFAPQPASRTNIVGTTADFSVLLLGADDLSYQWRFNGTPIAGATTNLYSLANVQTTNAGSYDVVVANVANSVTSQVAVLTVWAPPVITTQPQSQMVVTGATVNFTVAATGTEPLRYYWRFNGNPINGATTSAYSLGSVQSGNAGSYDVLVVNVYNQVTSQVASLTVWLPAAITTQPQSRTNVVRTPASFTVAATGTPPLSYQWRLNGQPIDGATTTRYSLASVQNNHAGSYDVVVTNVANSVASQVASLVVIDPLRFETTNGAVAVVNGAFQMWLVGLSLINPVVIEASTNLVDWEPVFTNATPNNPLFYSEPYDSRHISRFFRALEISIPPGMP